MTLMNSGDINKNGPDPNGKKTSFIKSSGVGFNKQIQQLNSDYGLDDKNNNNNNKNNNNG
jgi:hypothetical protein